MAARRISKICADKSVGFTMVEVQGFIHYTLPVWLMSTQNVKLASEVERSSM